MSIFLRYKYPYLILAILLRYCVLPSKVLMSIFLRYKYPYLILAILLRYCVLPSKVIPEEDGHSTMEGRKQ
jgi:hypothetical protein